MYIVKTFFFYDARREQNERVGSFLSNFLLTYDYSIKFNI